MPYSRQMLGRLMLAGALALPVCSGFAQLKAPPPTTEASIAFSAEELERDQVAAATATAYINLRKDVEQNWISPQMQVQDFVRRVKGEDALRRALRRAEQIGGPRWLDDQTCQVKLEISGERVASGIAEIAAADPRSPISPEEIARRLAGWKDRVFSATGTSIRADKVQEIKPSGVEGWRNVEDAARVSAINAARENAAQRVVEEIRPVQLDPNLRVGDVFDKNPEVVTHVREWLRRRPVTSLQFKDDLRVEYTLSVSRRRLVEEFFTVAQNAGLKMPDDEARAKLRDRFWQEIDDTTGVAEASPGASHNALPLIRSLPAQPPVWVFDQIDAEGTARYKQSLLRTKQEAEERATDSIRAKLLSKSLTQGMSVEEAARENAQIRSAVSRAVSRVRVYKVDYAADGSVTVKMMLDPREFWFDLNRP